jgi:acyl-CoA synthetase (AMP-forming)/AMP-acid ligase II
MTYHLLHHRPRCPYVKNFLRPLNKQFLHPSARSRTRLSGKKQQRLSNGGRVKVCGCAGGMVPAYLEDFFEAAKVEICVGYGLTEPSPVICNQFHEHNARRLAGLPQPGTYAEIVELETREPVPNSVTGELLVKGPQDLFAYYRNRSRLRSHLTTEATSKRAISRTLDWTATLSSPDVARTLSCYRTSKP